MAASTRATPPTGHSAFGRSTVSGRNRVPPPAASTSAATLSGMETRRWTNPTQPQTLQIAVFLLYINAVFGLLFFDALEIWGQLVSVAGLIGCVTGGFGIANERRWGYNVSLVVASAEVLSLLRIIFDFDASGFLISLMFAIALVALLLHPQSREYQKIWFS